LFSFTTCLNQKNSVARKQAKPVYSIKLALLSGLSRELIVDEAPIINMKSEMAAKIGNLLDSGT
jgi:hypothetical protein